MYGRQTYQSIRIGTHPGGGRHRSAKAVAAGGGQSGKVAATSTTGPHVIQTLQNPMTTIPGARRRRQWYSVQSVHITCKMYTMTCRCSTCRMVLVSCCDFIPESNKSTGQWAQAKVLCTTWVNSCNVHCTLYSRVRRFSQINNLNMGEGAFEKFSKANLL